MARLVDSLRLVRPHLPPSLATPDAAAALSALAERLPPVHRAGFECRLDGDPRVDLQQGIFQTRDEPSRLAAYLASARAEDLMVSPEWERIRSFCEAWADPNSSWHRLVSELWLEFDLETNLDLPGRSAPVPSVFLSFTPGETQAARMECVEALVRHFSGEPMRSSLRLAMRSCLSAAEPYGRLSHVGLMLARSTDAVRLIISQVPVRSAESYLVSLGWETAPARAVSGLMADMLEIVDFIKLSLDVGDHVYPQVGLESMFSQRFGRDPRWEPLFDRLVDAGLCLPSKRTGLLAWTGVITPVTATAPWPEDLVAYELLEPPDRLGCFDRRLSHVKISFRPGRDLSAKAYFGYGYLRSLGQDEVAGTEAGEVQAEDEVVAGTVPHQSPRASSPKAAARRTDAAGLTGADDTADAANVAVAADAAIAFLLGARNQAGLRRDFYDLERPSDPGRRITGYSSDEWVSAYIATVLAALDDEAALVAAREAWEVLCRRRGEDKGWGYHAQLPVDAEQHRLGAAARFDAGHLGDAANAGGAALDSCPDESGGRRRLLPRRRLPATCPLLADAGAL